MLAASLLKTGRMLDRVGASGGDMKVMFGGRLYHCV